MQLTLSAGTGSVPRLGRLDRAVRQRLPGGAWVAYVPGWLAGHEGLLRHLRDHTRWRDERREMYGREVAVPRRVARLPRDGPGHPVLGDAVRALSERAGRDLGAVSMAWYRDGRDSVAFHGDRVGARRRDTVVAVLGLGAPRRFLLRPRGGGESLRWSLGEGDLLVMGGTCQSTWEHAVPKTSRPVGPRISVMFREPRAQGGRPDA